MKDPKQATRREAALFIVALIWLLGGLATAIPLAPFRYLTELGLGTALICSLTLTVLWLAIPYVLIKQMDMIRARRERLYLVLNPKEKRLITLDKNRQPPAEWTNAACRELIDHAADLGRWGNPAGFRLTVALAPYMSDHEGDGQERKIPDEWDYDGIRQWILDHQDDVTHVWQLQIATA